jgi:hypothetical protein
VAFQVLLRPWSTIGGVLGFLGSLGRVTADLNTEYLLWIPAFAE